MNENPNSPEINSTPQQPEKQKPSQTPSVEIRKIKSLFGRYNLKNFPRKPEKIRPVLELKPKLELLVPPSYRPLPDLSTLKTLDLPDDTLKWFYQLLGETRGRREGYRFYPNSAEREELLMIFDKTADYLHDNNIKNFVILDRSARPAYVGVKAMWKKKYPDTSMPDIYFLNPTGFVNSTEAMTPGRSGISKGMEILFDGLMKGNDVGDAETAPQSQEEIELEFETTYKRLINNKDQPTLLFDSCIHSGDSIRPVQKTMQNLGFKELKIGSVGGSLNRSGISPDFVAVQGEPIGVCYPFDKDRMVERRFDSVTSSRSKNNRTRDRGIALRKEIIRIVNQDPQQGSPAPA